MDDEGERGRLHHSAMLLVMFALHRWLSDTGEGGGGGRELHLLSILSTILYVSATANVLDHLLDRKRPESSHTIHHVTGDLEWQYHINTMLEALL